MSARIVRFMQSVTRIGSDPRDGDALRLRKIVGVASVVMGGIPLMFGYGMLFWLLHEPFAGGVLLGAAALMLISVLGFSRSRNFAFYNIFWLLLTNLANFAATVSLGGYQRDGFFTFWGVVIPITAVITNKPRYAFGWFTLFVLEIVIMYVADPSLRHSNHLPAAVIAVLSAANMIFFAGYITCITLFFVLQQDALLQIIQAGKARSDTLLLNILPREIAERLKRDRQGDRQGDRQLIADSFSAVSILFADIVGFTPLSATLQPIQLVELLNEVFSYFDSLVEEYDLEKIKTIGDCYMVASGAPRERADHAQVLARMALRIQQQMKARRFGPGIALSFRIGINSGPVVAGVIGHKKFIYDLWGDTVNTASRMESHGDGGTVQITQATYDLIADDFECESRGVVPIKGKGEMPVWSVKAEKAA